MPIYMVTWNAKKTLDSWLKKSRLYNYYGNLLDADLSNCMLLVLPPPPNEWTDESTAWGYKPVSNPHLSVPHTWFCMLPVIYRFIVLSYSLHGWVKHMSSEVGNVLWWAAFLPTEDETSGHIRINIHRYIYIGYDAGNYIRLNRIIWLDEKNSCLKYRISIDKNNSSWNRSWTGKNNSCGNSS